MPRDPSPPSLVARPSRIQGRNAAAGSTWAPGETHSAKHAAGECRAPSLYRNYSCPSTSHVCHHCPAGIPGGSIEALGHRLCFYSVLLVLFWSVLFCSDVLCYSCVTRPTGYHVPIVCLCASYSTYITGQDSIRTQRTPPDRVVYCIQITATMVPISSLYHNEDGTGVGRGRK